MNVIEVGDGLPSTVCDPCIILLESSFAFKVLVESSALKLSIQTLKRVQSENIVKKEEIRSDDEGEAFANVDCGDMVEFCAEEKVESDQVLEETGENFKSILKCENCPKKFKSAHRWRAHVKMCGKRQTNVAAASPERDCDVKREEEKIQEDCKDVETDFVGLVDRRSSLELLNSCPVLEEGTAEGEQKLLARVECQNCKKYFNSSRGLNIHLAKCLGKRTRKKTHGMNGSIKNLNSGALETNNDKCSLKENERRHMCENCGRAFKSLCVLRQHAHTHDAPRFFHSCNRCGKKFTRFAHLITHHKIHDNVKPFICETCGRSFIKSSDLYRHRRVHSDSRTFPCTLCGKLFKRSGDVIVHMRTHTGNRPFQCAHCDKNYKSYSSLKKHKKHHAAEQRVNTEVEQAPTDIEVVCDKQKEASSPETH